MRTYVWTLLLPLAAALPAHAANGVAGDTQIVEGVVDDISGGDVVVRGENGAVRIGVFPAQVTDLTRGMRVKVIASPVLEGEQVTPLGAQRNPAGIRLTGTVESVLEDVLVLRVPEGGLREVRIDARAAHQLQPGQDVLVDVDGGEQGLRALGIVQESAPAVR
jgi:hypothetical protein